MKRQTLSGFEKYGKTKRRTQFLAEYRIPSNVDMRPLKLHPFWGTTPASKRVSWLWLKLTVNCRPRDVATDDVRRDLLSWGIDVAPLESLLSATLILQTAPQAYSHGAGAELGGAGTAPPASHTRDDRPAAGALASHRGAPVCTGRTQPALQARARPTRGAVRAGAALRAVASGYQETGANPARGASHHRGTHQDVPRCRLGARACGHR